MSYDLWKLTDPSDVELEERWDDVTSVEECVHGEHPLECSLCSTDPPCEHCGKPWKFTPLCPDCEQLVCLECGRVECACTSAGLIAAVSGEGEDMTMTAEEEHADAQVELMIDKFADEATVSQLKRAIYRIEHEVAKRKADNDRERKELEAFEKPVRATRRDKGTTRRKPEAA